MKKIYCDKCKEEVPPKDATELKLQWTALYSAGVATHDLCDPCATELNVLIADWFFPGKALDASVPSRKEGV